MGREMAGPLTIRTLDAHAAGEPLRIILSVYPEVSGSAFLTGTSEFWIDPADPVGHGFILR